MPTILIPSAAYVLSDYLITSEGNTVYNLIKHLSKYNYQFHAISAYVRIKTPVQNLTFYQVGTTQAKPAQNPINKYTQHIEFLIRSTIKAKKLLKQENIQIIHHMFPAVHNQTFSPLALIRGTKGKPFIFGPISAHITPRPTDEKLLQPITTKLHKKTIQKTDQLITITRQTKKLYQNTHKPITVIPLGVDLNTFKAATKSNNPTSEILYMGSLYPLKGVDDLIKAFSIVVKQHPQAKLRIIGTGPQEKPLKRLATKLKLNTKVTFQNFVPHTHIAQYYQNCTIFCFPSHGEPFGKTIIEAMACSKPVIATNVGGATEIIENNKTGILTPPAQPKTLAAAIIHLLDDPKKTRTIGENARKTAEQNYSWEKIAQKYHKLYQTYT
ncbi:MAG: glycosyltransferase family 4 protein [Candidatus Bathyarchaeales archaeon]